MDDVTERWLPAVGWEGFYEVSDLGRVRSLPRRSCRGQILKLSLSPLGYHRVGLFTPNRHRTCMIHMLVAEAFIGPRPDGQQLRHLDGDSLNNRPSNLTYGTPSENVFDQVRHGTHHNSRKTHCPRGHPYDQENTYIQGSSGSRGCRACQLVRKRRYRRERRAGKIGPMDTSVTPASLHGLTLEQIAALDTTDEVLARIVPESTPVPVAAI